MSGPKWTQEIIADLTRRVRDHNEGATGLAKRAKLADLKTAYARGHHGADEVARAAASSASVDRYLNRLAKGFDRDKHPRGTKGEFAPKGGAKTESKAAEPSPVSLVLPHTLAEHEELQADNPAYAALTSDVIPEQRNELVGQVARNAASLALGTGIIVGLSRSPSGRAARILRAGARGVGRNVIGVPVLATAYTASRLGHIAAGPVARRLGRKLGEERIAAKISDAAYRVGAKVGDGAGWTAVHGGHALISALMRAGEAKLPRFGRIGVLAGLSYGAGQAISASLKDTAIDPQMIGRGIDAYSYRTVAKMFGGDMVALDAARDEILAKIAADGGLAKLNLSGLYSAGGRRLLTGAAALTGGAAAAGAAEGVHAITGTRGNPHHDARGRFTSGAGAANAATAGAGLAGAAVAGLGAFAALRGHNVARLAESISNGVERVAESLREIHSQNGTGEVRQMLRDREHGIQNRMAEDKQHLNEKARLDAYAGSHDLHFKNRIREEVNAKLSSILSQMNEFRLPTAGTPPAKWPTIADIRAGAGPIKADRAAFDAVHGMIDTVSASNFKKALDASELTPKSRETAQHWFDQRQVAIDAVDSDIAGHKAKIDKAIEALAEAGRGKDAARIGLADARAVVDRAVGDEPKAAATALHSKAAEAVTAADLTEQKARKALDKLRDAPSGVLSPVNKKPIPPATQAELQPLYDRSRAAARGRAEKAIDKDITKARQVQSALAVRRGHRLLAAQALIGRVHGAIPKHAGEIGGQLADLRTELKGLRGKLASAHGAHTSAKEAADKLAQVQKGKLPKGMKPEDAADLRVRSQDIIEKRDAAAQDVEGLKAQIAAHEFRVAQKADAFRDAMNEGPAQPSAKRMSNSTYRALLRDVGRATHGARAPVDAFLDSPTAHRLRRVAIAGGQKAAGLSNSVYSAFVDAGRAAMMRKVGDGPDATYRFDPSKALLRGGLFAAAAEGGKDLYHYGRDQVGAALGTSDKPAPAKVPKSIRVERHVDPFSGAGFVGVSVTDPEDKGDRLLLWGERYRDATSPAEALHPGSRVSQLRQRYGGGGSSQNGHNGQRGGGAVAEARDVTNLPPEQRKKIDSAIDALGDKLHSVQVEDGHAIKFRANGDETKESEAGQFVGHVRDSFLKSGSPSSGKLYYGALDTVLGSNQGRILKQKQAYQLLTGFATGGQKKGHGVFRASEDSGFGDQSKSEVLDALKGEVDRVIEAHAPRDDRQATNLVRAVATVGRAKQIGDDDLKPLYEKVRASVTGASPAAAAPTASPAAPKIIQAEPPSQRRASKITAEAEAPADLPQGWDAEKLRDASFPHAQALAQTLGITREERVADTAKALEVFGRMLHQAQPAMPLKDAIAASADAVRSVASGGSANKVLARDALKDVNVDAFAHALDQHLATWERKKGIAKACFLDDLDALVKGVSQDAAEQGGKLFQSFEIDPGKLPREATDEGLDAAGRHRGAGRADGSHYTPIKITSDATGLLAGEGASWLATQAVTRLLPEESGAVKLADVLRGAFGAGGVGAAARAGATHVGGIVARGTAKTLASTAASLPAYAAGTAGGAAAVRGAYRAVGATPNETPPRQSAGEAISEGIGNVVGGVVGAGFGAGAGSILTGAAGGYVGGVLGRNAYDIGSRVAHYFSNYAPDKAQAVVGRMNAMSGAKTVSAPPAPGGKRGDPYHDRTGRFSGKDTAA